MRAETLKGHLDGLILATLAAGPAHGYAVIEQLKERSGGAFELAEGTVYPVLQRLEAEGCSQRLVETAGRKRRVYRPDAPRALGSGRPPPPVARVRGCRRGPVLAA
jgi:DNA-binding PadR family transcriptional regulator